MRSDDVVDDDDPSDAEPHDNAGMIVVDQFVSSMHQHSQPTETTEDEIVDIDEDDVGKISMMFLYCDANGSFLGARFEARRKW